MNSTRSAPAKTVRQFRTGRRRSGRFGSLTQRPSLNPKPKLGRSRIPKLRPKPASRNLTLRQSRSLKPKPNPEAKAEPKAESKAQPEPQAKAEIKPEIKDEPNPEAKTDQPKPDTKPATKPEVKNQPKPEAEDSKSSDVTPQLVKRVHEVYEELGREDVREVEEWEKAKREIPKDEVPK